MTNYSGNTTRIAIASPPSSNAEAINRQLAHYPYHIGQIVFIGKMLSENGWNSLSIPRGNSKAFNDNKFSQPKQRGHFTDDFLGK